ncbi:MAG TPA: hypothetical protein VMH27_02775 [Puia sp.]|nr:hypothetical protein [Puia sp.]
MKLTPDSEIALSASFIAMLSLGVSFWQLKMQRRFNRNSLRPLPWFYIRNGEDEFSVDLYNDGTGPMIIDNTHFELDGRTHTHLHCLLPKLEEGWNFTVLSHDKIIGAGKEVRIWEQTFTEPTEETFRRAAELKETLCRVKATIVYKDVYNHKYPPHERDFSFLKKMYCND